jgi:hypothetical protein
VSEVRSSVRGVLDGQPPSNAGDGVPVHVLPQDLAPALSDLELVADIWAADARESRYVAERAASVAVFARRRRIQRDRVAGSPGGPGPDTLARQPVVLADYSESMVAELALIRGCTEAEAESLAVESLILTTKLTATWSALYEGRIDVRRMRALVDLLSTARPKVAAEIERRVLSGAGDLTVPQLRQRVRRALARLDADALDARRAKAARRADVWHQPTGDGMSRLTAELPLAKAAACVDVVHRYAQLRREDGDRRPIGVIRADVAADLILRPWDSSRPPVTAQLVIHAPLTALAPAAPGVVQPAAEISGEIVTAAQCRELLEQLDMLGVRAAPAGGCVEVAVGDPSTGRLIALATRNELRRAAGTGRRRHTRRGAARTGSRAAPGSGAPPGSPDTGGSSTGPGSGAASGTATAASDGPGLRPPPATSRYRSTAAQRRFVRVRDRTCRMPGCRRPPGRCDLDHAIAHADGGETACWNLCCLCRRHHRIKTFAHDWHFELLADGRLLVRTPSGVSRITSPPGWTFEAEPDPPWLEEEAPPDRQRA